MAIQIRRGKWSDFDPAKLLPGEWACVLEGDSESVDGQSVYMCFNAGNVKRMATYDDMVQNIQNITTTIEQEFTQALDDAISAAETQLDDMETATTQANNAASTANQAASSANQATQAFLEAAEGTIINDTMPSSNTVFSSAHSEEVFVQNNDFITNTEIDDLSSET